jgi:hypothetical protein
MKIIRWILIAAAAIVGSIACGWAYTSAQLAIASARGAYAAPSTNWAPEQNPRFCM